MENARLKLDQSEKISTYLFKRPVQHILLIHVGAFTSEILEPLVQAYQAEEVKFIPLSLAFKVPIYQEDPKVAINCLLFPIDQRIAIQEQEANF